MGRSWGIEGAFLNVRRWKCMRIRVGWDESVFIMPLETRRAPIQCKQGDREKKSTACQMLYAPLLRAKIPMGVSSPSDCAAPLLHGYQISKIAFRQYKKAGSIRRRRKGMQCQWFLSATRPNAASPHLISRPESGNRVIMSFKYRGAYPSGVHR